MVGKRKPFRNIQGIRTIKAAKDPTNPEGLPDTVLIVLATWFFRIRSSRTQWLNKMKFQVGPEKTILPREMGVIGKMIFQLGLAEFSSLLEVGT